MVQNFFIGILIAAAGTAIVIYTESILAFAGRMEWADKWFGVYGGSRLGYKFIGMLAIVVGLLLATGLLGPIVFWLFGGLFTGFAPAPVQP